jgi:hypothetical protein
LTRLFRKLPSHLLAYLKLGLYHLSTPDTNKLYGPKTQVTTIQLSAFRIIAVPTHIGISKQRVGNKAMVKIKAIQIKSPLIKCPKLSWRLEELVRLIIDWGAWSSLIGAITAWVGSSDTAQTKTQE